MCLPKLSYPRKRRFLVPSGDALLSCLSSQLEECSDAGSEIIETVHFNNDKLSVPFGVCIKATRRLPDLAASGSDDFYFFDAPETNSDAGHAARRKLRLSEISEIAGAEHGLDGLRPYFAVQYRRARYGLKGSPSCLTIDSDVRYYSLLAERVLVGEEAHPRVKLGKRNEDAANSSRDIFEEALRGMKTLPVISKQWMGYSLMEEYYRFPLRNEFPLYEYEAKLDADGSDVDPASLPFEHLQSFKGQTIRRYYRGYRASFRAERATIVRRGEVQSLEGVSKRREIKEKGLSAWDLLEPWAEMSRYKKFFSMRNPETNRVYSVAIDRCIAGGVLCQAEVEYNGLLSKAGQVDEPALTGNSQAEAAVIADILLLRNALIEQYGFQPSALSKKKWLRKQMT